MSGLALSDSVGASGDRVLLVDGGAVCGAADASALVSPAGLMTPPPTPQVSVLQTDHEAFDWRAWPGKFCPGRNLDLSAGSASWGAAGNHSCYRKCRTACYGEECFCDGYYEGLDGPGSNALCVDSSLCQQLCAQNYADCASVDMHRDLPRCFLNSRADAPGCAPPVDEGMLLPKAEYSVLVPQPPREVEATVLGDASSAALLRFGLVEVRAMGTFTLCFCDYTVSSCHAVDDFRIELGRVYVSGLACLLEAGLQRGECTAQALGGLRCTAPLNGTLEELGAVGALEARDPLSEFCAHGPAGETVTDARCQ